MNDLILEINKQNLIDNINILSKNKDVIAMVKANCYGVGFDVIDILYENNIRKYGVSNLFEALEIRKTYKDCEIFLFTPIFKEDIDLVRENNITLIVSSIEELKLLDRRDRIHLKFDTMMGRLGLFKSQINEVIDIVSENNIKVEGILTHIPFATNKDITNKQIQKFKNIVSMLPFDFKYIHMQNTLGCANYDIDFCNMVRIGIGMYGLYSSKEDFEQSSINLKHVLSLKARVLMTKQYTGSVGYDLTEEVDGQISTLRIGYADGLSRKLQGYEFNNGSKIVGRVSMCQTIIATNNNIEYQEIFSENESIYDLMEYIDGITYEFLVALSLRIKRELQ